MSKTKSSKSYSIGDIISEEVPLVHVIDTEQKSLKCDYCLKSESSLKRCSKCLKMYYCGQNCQRMDWIWHKLECQLFINNKDQNFDDFSLRLLLRLWLAIKKSAELLDKKSQLFNGLHRCLNDFESHESEIRSDEYRMKQFEDICDSFRKCGIDFDNQRLFKLYGQLLINTFSIVIHELTYENRKSGYGVYICTSVFDHSCRPNVSIIFDGIRMQLRAIRDIGIDEEVFVHYIALDINRDERQLKLKSHYYFDCNCIKCCAEEKQAIDYQRFKQILSQLSPDIPEESLLTKTYPQIDELVSLSEQIYGPIHPELAIILMVVMQYRLLCPQPNYSSEEVSRFIERVGRVIELSFGANHKFYKMFKMFVNIKNMQI